jgi:nucleoid DNA-binding protein
MTRADLISILMNTELEEHRNLTREQARAVVSEIFEAIKDALRNGEVAHLPFGSFSVQEQSRKPKRRWFLKRVRVIYAQRNMIKFRGDKYDLEPATHVSAKVLDTETAKILGGITADIPRTRAVEELLSKGVTNCGQGANPGSGQQVVGTAPTPTATATAQIGAGFQISITGCRREGDWVRCSGSVLNRTADPISMRFNGGSFFIDNLGNQSVQGGVEFQLGSGGDRTEVEPDIPVKVLMSAKGLSGQATSVSLMLNVYRPEGKILLRNIPIQPN